MKCFNMTHALTQRRGKTICETFVQNKEPLFNLHVNLLGLKRETMLIKFVLTSVLLQPTEWNLKKENRS